MNKLRAASLVGASGVLLDQLLKLVIPVQVLNSGFFLGLQLHPGVLVSLHVLIVIAGVYYISRYKSQFGHWYLLLLVASISNLIDRVRIGMVIDYLQLMGIWFNLSDAIITGVIVILILNLGKEIYDARV